MSPKGLIINNELFTMRYLFIMLFHKCSYGLKRVHPVIGASTRARLSSGTHHPDADVVSADLQGDRRGPVVERDPLARAK